MNADSSAAKTLEPKPNTRHKLKVVRGSGGYRDWDEANLIRYRIEEYRISRALSEVHDRVARIKPRHDAI